LKATVQSPHNFITVIRHFRTWGTRSTRNRGNGVAS